MLTHSLLRIGLYAGIFVCLLIAAGYLYLVFHPQYAKPIINPASITLDMVDYRDNDRFKNVEPATPVTEKRSRLTAWSSFLFVTDENAIPPSVLPSSKTDLLNLPRDENVIVWMGHSSYFVQMDGLRILIDPVFSHNASPVPGTNVAFAGSNIYTADDIPALDYLLISHDHWDHLDYPSLIALEQKVSQVITPTGVSSYFTQWGYEKDKVHEGEWGSVYKGEAIDIHILPARHFSGRLFERNQTLWGSFALTTPSQRYYISGDTGYGAHFKKIGNELGPFDVAILECGQYDPNWADIHMSPEQTAQAALDLKANAIMAAHNSKFKLAHHTWDDPLKRLTKASEALPYRLLTPMIGETVQPENLEQAFKPWWVLVGTNTL